MKWLKSFLLAGALTLALSTPSCRDTEQPKPVIISEATPVVENIPGFQYTVQTGARSYFKPEETGYAIFTFYMTWLSTFGDPDGKVLNVLQNLTIMWEPDIFNLFDVIVYSELGQKISKKKVQVSGLTVNSNLIRVAYRGKGTGVEDSSLVHELVHAVLWHVTPESAGDADHLGGKYPGWTTKHSALKDLVNYSLANSKLEE